MAENQPPIKYRCAKCFHSLIGTEEHCQYCGKKVDLTAAARAEERYSRKRNKYYTSLKRRAFLQQAILTILLALLVIAFLMFLDHFHSDN